MSLANSAFVASNQVGVHPRLRTIVERHLNSKSSKPTAEHTRSAFMRVQKFIDSSKQRPLILDSGCGTGVSSIKLAQTHPAYIIVGVDKSAHRLQNIGAGGLPENCIVVRAELEGFWQLAVQQQWQLAKHFILYPNPWPKRRHIQRRWHGSAAFPLLPALGGTLELRTNWHTYALEFAAALHYAGRQCAVAPLSVAEPLTPFEAKYQASSHSLWRCSADLSLE